jgi:hypothetical protein
MACYKFILIKYVALFFCCLLCLYVYVCMYTHTHTHTISLVDFRDSKIRVGLCLEKICLDVSLLFHIQTYTTSYHMCHKQQSVNLLSNILLGFYEDDPEYSALKYLRDLFTFQYSVVYEKWCFTFFKLQWVKLGPKICRPLESFRDDRNVDYWWNATLWE